jgi:3-deoxy-manno-octulosonate cytidylyltransferase (CMP-KDO synthetase)
MLEVVWRNVASAGSLPRVIVATDDPRIADACGGFGAEAVMTSPEHLSGTDRVAEVVRSLDEAYDVVVNVQGDEPLVTGTSIDRLVESFRTSPPPAMATLSEPLESADDLFDPNVVKVVLDSRSRALYFSRSPIPYHRGGQAGLSANFREALRARPGGLEGYRRHQGIYAYARRTLLELTELPASPLERDEGLEQLRALEAGYSILVLPSDFHSIGVDTPEDLERVEALLDQWRTPAHDS